MRAIYVITLFLATSCGMNSGSTLLETTPNAQTEQEKNLVKLFGGKDAEQLFKGMAAYLDTQELKPLDGKELQALLKRRDHIDVTPEDGRYISIRFECMKMEFVEGSGYNPSLAEKLKEFQCSQAGMKVQWNLNQTLVKLATAKAVELTGEADSGAAEDLDANNQPVKIGTHYALHFALICAEKDIEGKLTYTCELKRQHIQVL